MSPSPCSKKCLDGLLLSLHFSHIYHLYHIILYIYISIKYTLIVISCHISHSFGLLWWWWRGDVASVFKAAGGGSVFGECHPLADLNAPWFSCPRYKIPWTWAKWSNCAILWQTHSGEADIKNINRIQKCLDLACWCLLQLQLHLDTSSREDCQLFDDMPLSEFGREEICES